MADTRRWLLCDARQRTSCRDVLLALVEHTLRQLAGTVETTK